MRVLALLQIFVIFRGRFVSSDAPSIAKPFTEIDQSTAFRTKRPPAIICGPGRFAATVWASDLELFWRNHALRA